MALFSIFNLLYTILALTQISINALTIAEEANRVPTRILIFDKPEVIQTLQEITIVQLNEAWNYTHATYAEIKSGNSSGPKAMKKFWFHLKTALGVITDQLHNIDRKIIEAQPNILLNQLFALQELDTIMGLGDTDIEKLDIATIWKIKWIEISSLSTHIHWLFNKRVRDIMNNVPYIKTIANSIAKYYGNPFYTRASGRTNSSHRFAQRNFPRWIDDILYSVPEGDLFFGLRQLLNNCTACSMGSATPRETCIKTRKIGKVLPVRLDAPVYIFFYTCLVDIKFYILKSFFHIYRKLYENNIYENYSIFDDRLRSRMLRKYNSYQAAFKDYDGQKKVGKKVMPGYFRCDPPQPNVTSPIRGHVLGKTFIKLTNIGSYFMMSEKELTPSGNCSSTCKDIAKIDRPACTGTDQECMRSMFPECTENPKLCEAFKPKCPLQETFCFHSGMKAKVCPSTNPGHLLNWIRFNDNMTETFPVGAANCSEKEVTYEGSIEPGTGSSSPQQCEICLCACFEPLSIAASSESVRFFSTNEAEALVSENRVVVGVKFEQIGNQIHIMIADAISIPNFKVDTLTTVWRKPKIAKNPEEVIRVSRTLRSVHMDSWRAPEGYVVTGVSFIAKSNGIPGTSDYQPFITMKLKATKVDPVTGKLDPSDSVYVTNPTVGMKAQYTYNAPGDPLLTDGPALPDNGANQFIMFRTTTIVKTAENHVIPFLDAQEVILPPNTNTPLRGVGIFHKRRLGFGGFLGIKILPHNEKDVEH